MAEQDHQARKQFDDEKEPTNEKAIRSSPCAFVKVAHASRLQAELRDREKQGRGLTRTFPEDDKFGGIRLPDEDDVLMYRDSPINPTAANKGECWQAILSKAKEKARSRQVEMVFLVVLLNEGKQGEAHALGLRVYGEGYEDTEFFDPNVGKFRFMRGAVDRFYAFTKDLMSELYTDRGTLLFDNWTLERISRDLSSAGRVE